MFMINYHIMTNMIKITQDLISELQRTNKRVKYLEDNLKGSINDGK